MSGKTEAEELASAFQETSQEWYTPDTVEMFCDFLVASNRLAVWQCEKLRKGQWKGFFFDDYVLIERIGKDYDSVYYKVRNTMDGTLACLAVTPRPTETGRRLEYRVGPYVE